ncbi:MAG: NAD(P)H-hydrate dehydratase [Planctomycetes bacterium]|nr:NAD(P)H-hydrate dehydratase [Planctomycetota bacterium]
MTTRDPRPRTARKSRTRPGAPRRSASDRKAGHQKRAAAPTPAAVERSWRLRPAPELPPSAHKGLAGRVLCWCGSDTMPGAAVLVARAAQRAGAGLVTLATDSDVLAHVVPVTAPEAIFARFDGERAWRSLLRTRDARSRAPDQARVAGPGLGDTRATRRGLGILLAEAGSTPLVLDADALNALAGDLGRLKRLQAPLVLTPHPGEAARLLGRTVGEDDRARLAAARELSAKSGAICCLKGRATVVAFGERVYVNATGNPGMATAGAGDVLAGILGAYLAACRTGIDPAWTPWDAACAAVHVHGLAGDLARARLGARGLVASDLIQFLPAAQERLRESSKLD